MQKDLINSIVDVDAIEKEISTVNAGLSGIMKNIESLAKDIVAAHNVIRGSNSFKELGDSVKDYISLVDKSKINAQEFSKLEQQKYQLEAKLAQLSLPPNAFLALSGGVESLRWRLCPTNFQFLEWSIL